MFARRKRSTFGWFLEVSRIAPFHSVLLLASLSDHSVLCLVNFRDWRSFQDGNQAHDGQVSVEHVRLVPILLSRVF